jgi:hypothetical protein
MATVHGDGLTGYVPVTARSRARPVRDPTSPGAAPELPIWAAPEDDKLGRR